MSLTDRRRRRKAAKTYYITASYRNVAVPLVTSRVGYGGTFAEALADADSQLPDGTWKRLVVTTPESVYGDLLTTRTARFARSTLRQGEGVTVRVEHRVSVEILES